RIRLELEAYARSALDERIATTVSEHLESCAACRAELAAIEPLVAALEELPSSKIHAARLAERIIASARTPSPAKRGRVGERAALLAALIIGGAAITIALRQPTPTPDPTPPPIKAPAPAPSVPVAPPTPPPEDLAPPSSEELTGPAPVPVPPPVEVVPS